MEKLVNILLVDDDEVDCMNVQRAFKKSNISNPLSIAHNGVEALDMLRGTNGAEKIIPTPTHHSFGYQYAKNERLGISERIKSR